MSDSIRDPARAAAHMRVDYTRGQLLEAEAGEQPFDLFGAWFYEALAADRDHANAFTLATINEEGHPAARVLLLKGFDAQGFTFYTNYDSRKGHELARHPHAAMNFFWAALERQVRIEGHTERVSRAESEEYFHSRPRESQIGAHASHQSSVLASRAELEERFAAANAKFQSGTVPLPENWGGYRLIPRMLEFWQGRASRLHDRLRYTRTADGWLRERLSP